MDSTLKKLAWYFFGQFQQQDSSRFDAKSGNRKVYLFYCNGLGVKILLWITQKIHFFYTRGVDKPQ